jgi:two-component system, LuxR family, sensor kinase FixL
MTAAPQDVLVVDDDPDTRANLCDILELDGHPVRTAGTAAEVLRVRDWARVAAVLLDRRLPDGTAEELLPWLRRQAPQAAVLIVTGHSDLQGAIAALRLGAADYILKPINADGLRASLARIAERRRLAQAKERSEAAFRTLVEAAPCLTIILRPDLSIAYFSPWAEEVTGHAAGAVLGKDALTLLVPPEQRAAAAETLRRTLTGRPPARTFEQPVLCGDGSARSMLWNARLLPDYEGSPAVLAVGQDITELKRAQERTLQAERLAAIGQMVTGLAHESGNALARSQACLELLALEVQDRPEALDLVARVQQAQDHLQQLYEDVRGYAAPLRLDRAPTDVRDVWRRAWDSLAARRQGRAAVLREEADGTDRTCAADPFRLEQVFRNVLENALAACRDPVAITIACADATLEGRPALCVSVRDNGPGLGPEQRRRLFEPFYTTKTKGTGLGMPISKRIVEAHGGRIDIGPLRIADCGLRIEDRTIEAPLSSNPQSAIHNPQSGAEIILALPRDEP